MNKIATFIAGIAAVIVLTIIGGLILSLPVMLLWNGCLVPAVSGLHEIEWLQAWGLMILFGLLFNRSTTVNKNG